MYIGNIIIPIKIILLNHFFYDIWEHVKSRYLFKNISSKGFQNLPVLSVTQDKGVIYRDSLDIDIKYDSSTLKNYKLVQPGDFIISLRSFQGGFETSYLTGITSPAYTIFNFIDNQSQNHMFWQYLFKRKNFINSLKKVTFGIRDGKAISFSQFGDVKVEYPDFGEQKHIAITLNKIDDAIQLHERKCEELALIKKALLQKLFPKKDEIKPEVRYKNFSDAWEQRKLGEVVERFDNLRIPVTSSKREKGITPYYGANGIQDYVQGYTHDGEFVLVAEDGANDLQNYPVHYVNGKVWVNNHAHVLQGKNKMVDNLFLVNAIKQIKIETYLVGGSRAKLNADVMMKLPIKVPTFNEQQKIGEYFSKFDTLITLHQRKLEKLKQLKKFLLQNMFI
ncbi:restriction endonuclease subunit S [Ligilactobacillus salivarius]|uniref:restriction endonuclease subunit S n=1 Tax=Ligilactobacillus salivarius TaxID=1624 RepID=UPI0024BA88E1|nr:restriction endonuclease subunit S [Ligilactobacillus salivarius]WHS10700.1 restriction endonuclease subunit S [Ligilactobacillus salivarius]WHS14638.1 restriction endonuclease subunit S [Ligilactobacillus salivarius]WHS22097.1 restriction endonuclease subunit S [Ligilactobacillus salivarius]